MQVALTPTSKASRPARGGRAVCRAAPEAAQAGVSRRAAAATLAAAVVALSGGPAHALFGLEEAAKKEYEDRTTKLLADIRTTVSMTGDDDAKEAAVKTLKKEMNDWTAKYRNSSEGGRPSFSNMYSAVNALAGHWTSFGSDAPVPKKRMARISKELEDVDKYLARGR